MFVPPLLADLPELRNFIYAADAKVTPYVPARVWNKIDFRWDVCHITTHIEQKLLFDEKLDESCFKMPPQPTVNWSECPLFPLLKGSTHF